ncbi:MAG: DUF2914 domain-containing protein [Bdellovibrionaceae bacterium]|nr:DUF2914 domain-containing protein [Pseudobdellovibrionaceae bacterium]
MIQFLKDKLAHRPKTSAQSWAQYYAANEALFGSLIFIGGFVFDIFTLSDYDDPFALIQQSVYLVLIGLFIYLETLDNRQSLTLPPWAQKAWVLREIGMHFLLGSLLSLYSLFFFKSASLATALIFMIAMAALLVANEFPQLQRRGPIIRWALWTLCLMCFLQILMPILFTYVGLIPFLFAWTISGLVLACVAWLLTRAFTSQLRETRSLLWPSAAALVVFLVLYIFKAVPPVPIVLKDIGIFHKVEKVGDAYILTEERPWWKFWHRGDQDFQAKPGDLIYAYFAIASPGRIQDQIKLRWMFKDPRAGWTSMDAQNIAIRGGRGDGYRGFAFKKNYQEGKWRVQVETSDDREIGRLSFEVTKVPAPPAGEAPATHSRSAPGTGDQAPAVSLPGLAEPPAPPPPPPSTETETEDAPVPEAPSAGDDVDPLPPSVEEVTE